MGFADLIIGGHAAANIGVEKVPHIQETISTWSV